MWKKLAVSLSIGVLVVPVVAAQSGRSVLAGEVLRPSAEEWCPQGAQSSPDSDCITPPVLINAVSPQYPDIARRGRITGVVSLEAVVAESGRVAEVRVVKPNRVFADAAVAAVKQRSYKPAYRNGRPVAISFPVTVRFELVAPGGRQRLGGPSGDGEIVSVVAIDPKTAIDVTQQRQASRRNTQGTKK